MRHELSALLGGYESAVLTVFEIDGRPTSVRCRPTPLDDGSVSVELPAWVDPAPGRAGLMAHYHDARLWHQKSFTCRGRLESDHGRWAFRPEETILGMGYGPFSLIRMMIRGRRRAARYLAHRGIEPPDVPWDQLKSIKREAFGRQH